MIPTTKRTKAVKKPRKITPKRAVHRKSRRMKIGTTETPLSKLHKLKYCINDDAKEGGGWSINMEMDKDWVMEEITNLRDGGWLSTSKMKVANEMWRNYAR